MFSKAWGDTVLPTTVEPQKVDLPTPPAPQGGIGVGTWATAAEFKDITVTQNGNTLYASDFTAPLQGWRQVAGKWDVKDGALEQTQMGTEIRATTGDGSWQDYTLNLKARKTSGNEGFLVLFHVRGRNTYDWFNVGGWKNSAAGLEETQDGGRTALGESVPFKVETGRWYDIRVELQGRAIKCYVDDKLVVQATDTPSQPTETLFAAASKVDSTGEVILKVVNTVDVAQNIQINLQGINGIAKDATVEILQGDPNGQNSVDAPTRIAPTQATIDNAGPSFVHEFPANSVSVIRLKGQ
jgi:alpha-L-arabinofuranosidase